MFPVPVYVPQITNRQAKERPILYGPEMVRAILANDKSQTRRVIHPQPGFEFLSSDWSPTETRRSPMRIELRSGHRIEDYRPGLIRVHAGETAEVIRRFGVRALAIGMSWVALRWDEGQPMPAAVKLVGEMRGVLKENRDGAGI